MVPGVASTHHRWYYFAGLLTTLVHTKTNTHTTFILFVSSRLDMCDRLTLWEPAYDTFVLQFRPKKQQFSVALPTP